MRAASALLITLVLAGTGCDRILGIGNTTLANDDAGPIPDGMSDAMDPALITGNVLHRYLFDGQTTDVPDDLAATQIEAFHEETGGTFTSYAGSGATDGTFRIPNTPQDTLWIRVGNRYYLTDQRHIELVTGDIRRAQIEVATQATPLGLSLTNMAPWQGGDLEIFSPGGVWIDPLIITGVTPPSTGVTSYSLVEDYRNFGEVLGSTPLPLLQGDPLYVTQLVPKTTTGGLSYNALDRVATPTPITQIDGQESDINAALSTPARSEDMTIDWHGSDFDAQTAAMCHGTIQYQYWNLSAFAVPYGLDFHINGLATATLVNVLVSAADASLDLHYRDPFPADWGTYVVSTHQCVVSTSFGYQYAINMENWPVAKIADAGTPRIAPPTAVQVDGSPAQDELVIQSTSPVITWTAPTIGTPTTYVVSIDDVSNSTRMRLATLYVHGTRVRVPPDILQSGRAYVVHVTAELGMDPLDASLSPFDSAYVQTMTAPIIIDHPPVMSVSTSGDDGNIGTTNAPFRTITHALSVATLGDRIEVQPGTYDSGGGETFPLAVPAGVTLESANGNGSTIIRGGNATADPSLTVSLANGAHLEGFTVENDQASSGTTIAVEITDAGVEVRNNIITGVITSGTSDGILVTGNGDQQVIAENQITGHNDVGIIFVSSIRPLVENNVITGNRGGIALESIVQGDLGGGTQSSAGGNTLSCNTDYDLYALTDFGSIDAKNNVWDHTPPSQASGTPQNGIDIDFEDAAQAGAIAPTNATVASPACP